MYRSLRGVATNSIATRRHARSREAAKPRGPREATACTITRLVDEQRDSGSGATMHGFRSRRSAARSRASEHPCLSNFVSCCDGCDCCDAAFLATEIVGQSPNRNALLRRSDAFQSQRITASIRSERGASFRFRSTQRLTTPRRRASEPASGSAPATNPPSSRSPPRHR